MTKRIDLHIHTVVSDGTLTPKEVIDEAYKNNISVIAIADHDTVDAYNNELFEYAKNKKIKLITAVEISTKTKKAGIHVLGYNIDLNNEELKEKLKKIRNTRHEYLHDVAKKLEELKYHINVAELDKIEAVTKAHIALNTIENPVNKEKLLLEFGHIPTKGEFIENIMNENCPAYVQRKTVSPKEAAQIIRNAKGKVVLAHPIAYIHEDNFTEEDILDIIKELKPDGLEANYLYIDRNNKRIDETKKWNEFAKRNNLFVTAGSDFHIKDGIKTEIGFVNTDFILPENVINEIIMNLEK
ncbi:MAG: PHP domain-containing protein [Clostridia bacterium]|nr:PHP domain-containing protein [Clostridia bacterium]